MNKLRSFSSCPYFSYANRRSTTGDRDDLTGISRDPVGLSIFARAVQATLLRLILEAIYLEKYVRPHLIAFLD